MIKCTVVGYERLKNSKGIFYKVHAVSEEEHHVGFGFVVFSEFVDEAHLRKHGVDEGNLLNHTCQHYNIKDGDRWKSGLTFKL